jgi:DNA oxidative demethylase
MIGILFQLSPEEQKVLHEAVLSAQGDMPAVTKTMPVSGAKFHYKCFSLGTWGWHSDLQGFRYQRFHPETADPWPPFPQALVDLIDRAKAHPNLNDPKFHPDSALVNLYEPGDTLGIHVDKTEECRTAPILSVSLGLPAVFTYGPPNSAGTKPSKLPYQKTLASGDVFLMSEKERNWWHAIPLVYPSQPNHPNFPNPLNLPYRMNLTIRQNLP